jgi:hypothetical protein
MDLLVQDGWVPSYSIAAVLLQIRMAISSLEPRPARLARNGDWKRPYGAQEAFEGWCAPKCLIICIHCFQDSRGLRPPTAGGCQRELNSLCYDKTRSTVVFF